MAHAAIPGNRVVALLSDAHAGLAVRDALAAAGLEEATLVTGLGPGQRMEIEDGPLVRMLHRLSSPSRETRYLDNYEDAVRSGQTVVVVKAIGHTDVRRAKEVLQKYGATDIRYFGRLAVSELATGSRTSGRRGDGQASRPAERSHDESGRSLSR